MNGTIRSTFLSILSLLFACWLGSAPAAGLDLELTDSSARAVGATPGGEVAWLVLTRELNPQGGTDVHIVDQVLPDEDQDGAVALELGRAVPELSVWVAVDVTSGETAVTTPGRFVPEVVEGRFDRPSGGVELPMSRAVALWVRPGLGAFRGRGRDGGAGDEDRTPDGLIALGPRGFDGPAGPPPEPGAPEDLPVPPAFRSGDVLVAVDAGTLAVTAFRIDAPGNPR